MVQLKSGEQKLAVKLSKKWKFLKKKKKLKRLRQTNIKLTNKFLKIIQLLRVIFNLHRLWNTQENKSTINSQWQWQWFICHNETLSLWWSFHCRVQDTKQSWKYCDWECENRTEALWINIWSRSSYSCKSNQEQNFFRVFCRFEEKWRMWGSFCWRKVFNDC